MQTACSTSLVAVAQACQALLGYQTDMALAGGVSISFPQRRAYVYQEGGMASADGHTRTFDAAAAGTVFSSGAGVVVLKRLADALADGDHIVAVIKGAAVNNDGAGKVSLHRARASTGRRRSSRWRRRSRVSRRTRFPTSRRTAPPHRWVTPSNSPALTQAFRAGGATANGFCALGSLKTNVGHLETASGVAALIKTALALQHALIPPSLHFSAPNPKLDLANSPFYVNTRLAAVAAEATTPRRAGVSSFGVGGTNAHAVLEEAPARTRRPRRPRREHQLFVLSAKTDTALDTATDNLARHFRSEPTLDPADVAFTLQLGRRAWNHRRIVVASTLEDAAGALAGRDARRVFSRHDAREGDTGGVPFPGAGRAGGQHGRGTVPGRAGVPRGDGPLRGNPASVVRPARNPLPGDG